MNERICRKQDFFHMANWRFTVNVKSERVNELEKAVNSDVTARLGMLLDVPPFSSALAAPQKSASGTIMKEITRINHVGIRVRDLDVSREFYGKLGFEFIVGPMGPEPVAIVEHPCGININLILNATGDATGNNVLMDDVVKYPGYTHIALEITDYDSAKNNIEASGFSITEEVEYNGARFFFIRDPDGNVLEFHQPASS